MLSSELFDYIFTDTGENQSAVPCDNDVIMSYWVRSIGHRTAPSRVSCQNFVCVYNMWLFFVFWKLHSKSTQLKNQRGHVPPRFEWTRGLWSLPWVNCTQSTMFIFMLEHLKAAFKWEMSSYWSYRSYSFKSNEWFSIIILLFGSY